MRSLLFNLTFGVVSVGYALSAALLSFLPGPAMQRTIRRYTRAMLWLMHRVADIRVELRGQEHLPAGAFLIAAKHQSYGDGFVMYANVDDLTFVTGDHLERFPLLGGVLRKLGAIVVDNCGGPEARADLAREAAAAHQAGKRILIYPEGHLAKVGERFRYRSGVWHMARDFDLPVVPVATNLGLRWPQQEWAKHPGLATVEFLPPMAAGEDKAAFLAELERVVEGRTAELIAMVSGSAPSPARLVAAPGEALPA